jgi:hypothetical protein
MYSIMENACAPGHAVAIDTIAPFGSPSTPKMEPGASDSRSSKSTICLLTARCG